MIGDMLAGVGGVILRIAGGIIAVVVIGVLIWLGWNFYVKKFKRFQQFNVVIWQKDGFSQFKIKYDKAGIFIDDATKNKRLFLKQANVGLNPDNVPYLTSSSGKKTIYLLQTGLKNFKYIKPNITDDYISFTVGEEDVNWAINSYQRDKQRFSQSWLMQYLPFIILAFVCMIILVLFMQLFKQFPVMKEMLAEMTEIAKYLAQAKTGTITIP